MSWYARLFHWLATPFRAAVSLSREQVRSLYSVALLAGIVALSACGAATVWLAEDAALANPPWFKLLIEVTRYIFALIGLFALIVALTVFGADYLKAKWADKELSFGKGDEE